MLQSNLLKVWLLPRLNFDATFEMTTEKTNSLQKHDYRRDSEYCEQQIASSSQTLIYFHRNATVNNIQEIERGGNIYCILINQVYKFMRKVQVQNFLLQIFCYGMVLHKCKIVTSRLFMLVICIYIIVLKYVTSKRSQFKSYGSKFLDVKLLY